MSQTRMSELAAAEAAEKTAILVYNEQAKLQANALDRASTTLMSVGVIASIAADLYGLGTKIAVGRQVAWFVIWGVFAAAFHVAARHSLGYLQRSR
jgi:hypothetical protein